MVDTNANKLSSTMKSCMYCCRSHSAVIVYKLMLGLTQLYLNLTQTREWFATIDGQLNYKARTSRLNQ